MSNISNHKKHVAEAEETLVACLREAVKKLAVMESLTPTLQASKVTMEKALALPKDKLERELIKSVSPAQKEMDKVVKIAKDSFKALQEASKECDWEISQSIALSTRAGYLLEQCRTLEGKNINFNLKYSAARENIDMWKAAIMKISPDSYNAIVAEVAAVKAAADKTAAVSISVSEGLVDFIKTAASSLWGTIRSFFMGVARVTDGANDVAEDCAVANDSTEEGLNDIESLLDQLADYVEA